MAQKGENTPLNITYGHNDALVLVQFSRPVAVVGMNSKEVDDFVAGVTKARAMLAEHQTKKAN